MACGRSSEWWRGRADQINHRFATKGAARIAFKPRSDAPGMEVGSTAASLARQHNHILLLKPIATNAALSLWHCFDQQGLKAGLFHPPGRRRGTYGSLARHELGRSPGRHGRLMAQYLRVTSRRRLHVGGQLRCRACWSNLRLRCLARRARYLLLSCIFWAALGPFGGLRSRIRHGQLVQAATELGLQLLQLRAAQVAQVREIWVGACCQLISAIQKGLEVR
mmetsp:Transcript_49133/g.92101  ORF Transcript_49133/g.92101 Transcript_49133/m.92101 type:complete len:222 (+) Transcript_49133:586-1251(+)